MNQLKYEYKVRLKCTYEVKKLVHKFESIQKIVKKFVTPPQL